MTGAIFNNSGKMVYNTGTINGPVSGGDMTMNDARGGEGPGRPVSGTERPLVFINYRSTDEAWAATVVWQVWAERIGKHRVFLDNQSIGLGRRFDTELLEAVEGSAAVLAIIGSRWHGTQSDGRRLIDDENDWVHREIRHALNHGVPVVPVLIDRKKLDTHELPAELAELARFQYCTIRRRYWHSDLAGLVATVCKLNERLAAEAGVYE
jgi:TIR domain-containing protein